MGEQPQWQGSGQQGWNPQPGYGPSGHGSPGGLSPADERTWGLVAHLSGLVAAFFFVGFLGPLVVLLVQGSKSAFVRRHAVEALNFWILLFVLGVVGIVFGVLTLGLGFFVVVPVAAVVGIASVVFGILAAIAANNGQDYRYPVNVRLVK